MDKLSKEELSSLSIKEEQLKKLNELFPEVFTEGNKIDWDKLRLTLGEQIDVGKERFGMNWPGKADCFKTIQQPSIATLVPAREESVDFDTTQNLFIEGDNLEVLKLLQKSYLGKIKMIYIDPPYNTGNDFIYPDNYSENLQTYLEYTGQVDSEGRKFSTNAETDGRFHSKWMNMIYPRLFLAKNLLRQDGAIFISIDDNELINLKAICNEIFGEENFIAQIEWQKRYTRSNNTDNFTTVVEHILLYQRSDSFKTNLLPREKEADERYSNPDNDSRGPWKSIPFLNMATPEQRPNLAYEITNPNTGEIIKPTRKAWRSSKSVYESLVRENKIWWGQDGKSSSPNVKRFLTEVKQGLTPINYWSHEFAGHTDNAANEIKELLGEKVFDTPKPSKLIKQMLLLSTSTDENDLILDFFAGSGSTAHAVIELNKEDVGNRRFICVQLPHIVESNSEAHKAGFKNISEIGQERIRKLIVRIKEGNEKSSDIFKTDINDLDLGLKIFKLKPSNFNLWRADVEKTQEALAKQLELNIAHISAEATQEAILYELLLKSGFELTTPVAKEAIASKTVYSIAEGELLICLEKELTQDVIKGIAEKKPSRVICLDEGFQNNDQLKTNAVQIMKSKGVVKFQTV